GITVLFSSHHLHQVQQVCDRVGLFVGGKLLAIGDIESLAGQLFGEDTSKMAPGKREYGLDDIYFRYFEGGKVNE
ncbi:hypothetical protein EG827_09185, partial [bacterium]|nr:hypothetical protein [bacterium]